jgi:hypothetical protein
MRQQHNRLKPSNIRLLNRNLKLNVLSELTLRLERHIYDSTKRDFLTNLASVVVQGCVRLFIDHLNHCG